MPRDTGLDTLLDLDGTIIDQRVEYDHAHQHMTDPGKPYEFVDAYQLLKDFFAAVDQVLRAQRGDE